jgi:SAM-dependent methyltransferase
MDANGKRVDWATPCWRRMLVDNRKFMWHEDTIEKLASWMGLRHGMTVVDVGCGLGYLGYTYWQFFGEDGCYLGVDISPKLARDASEAAREWAVGGLAKFSAGDICRLPLPDDFADAVMCQIVFMHLEHPTPALAEMIRVTKPGGVVVCLETDTSSAWLSKHFITLPPLDLEEELLLRKVYLLAGEGRIKLGRGDNRIGARIPSMMNDLGLRDIDIRLNDNVAMLLPPYEGERDLNMVHSLRKRFLEGETYELEMNMLQEEFLAAGGDQMEFDRFRETGLRVNEALGQQIDDGEYAVCGTYCFYVIKGTKPA